MVVHTNLSQWFAFYINQIGRTQSGQEAFGKGPSPGGRIPIPQKQVCAKAMWATSRRTGKVNCDDKNILQLVVPTM